MILALTRRATALLLAVGLANAADPATGRFQFGISESLIGKNVTQAEAVKAIRVWATEIYRQAPGFTSFEVSVPSAGEVPKRLRQGDIDGVVVTALEYRSMATLVDSRVMVDESAPDGEEYLVLVHRDSGFKTLSDLRGRKIVFLDRPRMNLALPWMDMALANAKLGSPDTFFSAVSNNPKLNLTVLSVFFKTMDACVVTRRGLALMKELNPQVGVKLQAVATSPKLVPSILVYRKDCPAPRRRDFEHALQLLKGAPAGQQALALFEGTGVVQAEISVIRPALDLLAAHDLLRSRSGGAAK